MLIYLLIDLIRLFIYLLFYIDIFVFIL